MNLDWGYGSTKNKIADPKQEEKNELDVLSIEGWRLLL
jgi:hypothetical protein